MKVVLQRVKKASVRINNKVFSSIGRGLVLLLGIAEDDTEKQISWFCKKSLNLRVFPDERAQMNKSVLDIGGQILLVSQFTLLGDVRRGNRPSFSQAEKPERAKKLYTKFKQTLQKSGLVVEEGVFGADMVVSLQNDGPVTIIIEDKRGINV